MAASRLSSVVLSFLIALLLPGAGCAGPDGPSSSDPLVWDSAGVTIVEVPAPDAEPPEWRVEAEPFLSIGEADGDEAYLFSYVAGALRLDDGRIVVANDGPARRLHVFDAAGRHLEYWGRGGQGPGELAMGPFGLYRAPDGAVVVPELGARTVHVFEADGSFRERAALEYERVVDPEERASSASCCAFAEVLADGSRLAYYPEEGILEGSGTRRGEYVLARFDPEGGWEGIFARYPGSLWRPGGSGESALVRLPLTGSLATAVSGDELFVGNGAEYRVDVFDLEGNHRRSVRAALELPPFEGAAREAYLERRLEGLRRMQGDEAAARMRPRLEADLPERLPAFSQILVGASGELWLVAPSVPGAEGPRPVLILDNEGRILGSAELPAGFRPFQVGEDWVLGRTEDELGVVRVAMHRFVRPD